MLSHMRRAAARSLVNSRRTIASSSGVDATLDEALSTVGLLTTGESSSMAGVAKIPPPTPAVAQPAPPPHGPQILNLPPVEDPVLAFLTNCIMRDGDRKKAQRLTTRTLMYIHTLTRAPPLPILRQALFAAAPAVRCISSRHAGRTVVYPVPLSERQRMRKAIEWVLKSCDDRQEQTLPERLAKECVALVQGGEDISKVNKALRVKEEVHKLAMANRGNVQRPRL